MSAFVPARSAPAMASTATPLGTPLAFGLAAVLGSGAIAIAPLLVGAWIDHLGFSPAQAGVLVAVEQLGIAVAALAVSPRIDRWDRGRLARLGAAVLLVASLVSAGATGPATLGAARFAAGVGSGLALAVVWATAAGTDAPERTYSTMLLWMTLFPTLALATMPPAFSVVGPAAAFALYAALALALLVAMGRSAVAPPAATAARVASGGTPSMDALALLAALLLLHFGHVAVWAYQERMGLAVGLPPTVIGVVLGSATLAGAGGALLARRLGRRYGWIVPQVVSFGGSIVAALILMFGGRYGFLAASYLVMVTWFYGMPYLTAMLAELDPTGRFAAAASGACTIGLAIGPAAAAWLVAGRAYTTAGWLAIASYVACVLLVLPVAVRLTRTRGSRPQENPR